MIEIRVYSSSWSNRRNIDLRLIFDRLSKKYGDKMMFVWHDTGTLNAAEVSRKYGVIGALPSFYIYKDRDFKYCKAGGVADYDTYRRALEGVIKGD